MCSRYVPQQRDWRMHIVSCRRVSTKCGADLLPQLPISYCTKQNRSKEMSCTSRYNEIYMYYNLSLERMLIIFVALHVYLVFVSQKIHSIANQTTLVSDQTILVLRHTIRTPASTNTSTVLDTKVDVTRCPAQPRSFGIQKTTLVLLCRRFHLAIPTKLFTHKKIKCLTNLLIKFETF